MTQTELFEELQRLQIENATLLERIASLKQQNGDADRSGEDCESESYGTEIASIKDRISAEQQETAELKRELNVLIWTQEDLQRRLEEEGSALASALAPLLRAEEAQTQRFYDGLLAKCEGIDGVDVQQLRTLVDGVQTKRRAVSDATDENQKIHRLIGLNKAQTDRPTIPQPMTLPPPPPRPGVVQPVTLGGIERQVPRSSSVSPKVQRRRVSFKPKGEVT
jgi:chromosome segregation ATPase